MTQNGTRTPRAPRVPLPDIYGPLHKERGEALRAAAVAAHVAAVAVAALLPAAGHP